ncbi:hypothetical protein ACF07V_08905 [Streptomyces sp. NPDC015661]|uniref:hypothetical protein n=1 Tax=Streptomyces sp. NPDC015661 TaxID=3364961 RepID=UPI0036F60956
MARSTIQEKLTGKSPLNLLQILMIVDALAEYAQNNETPLPKHEINPQTWQDRIAAASRANPPSPKGESAESKEVSTQGIEWNIQQLRQAQMEDLVNTILEHRSNPVAEWLPRVLREMTQAQMSMTDFLRRAAEDSPQGIVGTIKALDREFPYDSDHTDNNGWGSGRSYQNLETVGLLLNYTAIRHGSTAAPAIVVGLRRANLTFYVEEFLKRVGTWHLPKEIEKSVDHLRVAGLGKDVDVVLQAAAERKSDRIYEVVVHFQKIERPGDARVILQAIGALREYSMHAAIKDFMKRDAPEEMLTEIARGVPYEDYEDLIEKFTVWGLDFPLSSGMGTVFRRHTELCAEGGWAQPKSSSEQLSTPMACVLRSLLARSTSGRSVRP